ncbi:hypothetical protein [Hyphomicrobium sp. 2TAF46]|uniref:hypothetical protein n=1 Tax=Hyphomicrobium sp. 2TAF46 TaxID=3233019 RepID=UPI003F905C0C
MTCYAKGNLRYRTSATTAVIVLMAGSYLTMSGTSAKTEPRESGAEAGKDDGWITTLSSAAPANSQSEEKRENETIVPKQYLGGDVSKSTAEEENGEKPRKKSQSTKSAFRSDPQYEKKYDAEGQSEIYGGKTAVEPPRPLLELGREQYTSGIYDESSTLFGKLNPLLPGLSVYGDWRTAVAYNSNNGKDIAQVATRLNLDVDFKLTATERIHAFFTPLQDGTKFTRFEFGGGDGNGKFNDELNLNPQTLFFEGDAGSIYSGLTGQYAGFDLPFTVGLFPLFLQNGIWANDAILGGAVTLPAKNSAALGLSNFDITFFAGFDNIDNASFVKANGKIDNDNANLFGVTTFVDAFNGYIEAGYGFLQGTGPEAGVEQHFLTAAYSRRYANTISNSTRVFANFGDDGHGNGDGVAIISENSLISPLPSTLLPYANFFVGFGNPTPLVDGNNAGILKNVGINFETDALTGYPKLDDTASSTFGGALGVEYLFNLDQQLVFEVATVQPFENDNIGAKGAQYGFGVRYQIPITRSWLFRADATYQIQEGADDNFGFRTELRSKF